MPHFILKKHEKDFQKILNSLICDIVTSVLNYNDVMGQLVAIRVLSFSRAGTGMRD